METPTIKTDFNPNIDINLCCGNCIYKLDYSYTGKGEQLSKGIFMNKHIANTICLIDKNPQQLTSNNQFDEELTCNMHNLGSSLGGNIINCPTDIENINNNATLKILFNLKPDIVRRFNDINLLQAYYKLMK